mmetsp:Transcript_12930/g.24418  ORF Transcript_12930/g.24418 Transcript_12930/m.24418 type:complete len:204 (-) Transcript_12930:625-1236(-)
MLAAKHPEYSTALVTTDNYGTKVCNNEGPGCGSTGRIIRVANGKNQHNEDGACQMASRSVHHRENGQVIRLSKDISVHLLPATLVTNTVQIFQLLSLAGRISCEIALERLHEYYCNYRAEKEAQHERVHNGEPVYLMLKKLRIKVAVRPVLELVAGREPLHRVREIQRSPSIDRPWCRRLHVYLNDLVAVVEKCEMTVGVYSW